MCRSSWLLLPFLFACPGTVSGPQVCAVTDGPGVLQTRCLSCHSVNVTGVPRAGASAGVDFDTETDVRRWSSRIRSRTLIDKTMPPGVPIPACEDPLLDAYLTSLANSTCTPSCEGRACGDDSCGGSCGSCQPNENCGAAGQCTPGGTCLPDCTGKACGDDGCGGSCGSCSIGNTCSTQGTCECAQQGQCGCAPTCSGKQCGDDGCGGSCGTCPGDASCSNGACTVVPRSYATDVQPIWVRQGCASNGCHGGARPSEGLDLRSASAGYADLVNVASSQCATRPLVKPNDVAGSYLMNKLTGSGMCSGSAMPKAGGGLTTAELDTVRAWILSNAAP